MEPGFEFLSTLSLRRATSNIVNGNCNFTHFYPRSPCGERQPARTRNDKHNVFLSTLSLRRATVVSSAGTTGKSFLSTLSLRRATGFIIKARFHMVYFYPRSPCGERHTHPIGVFVRVVFLSTLSLRRATTCLSACFVGVAYFYPRSPCGERRGTLSDTSDVTAISIHALLAESDLFKNHIFFCHSLFLSTLSLRRATGWLQVFY